MTKKNAIVIPDFRRPRPFAELGGNLGVTTLDVAAALGIGHNIVLRKLSRRGYADLMKDVGLEVVELGGGIDPIGSIPGKSGTARPGRRAEVWALESDAAEVFCAQYGNDRGVRYAYYLVECRKAAERAHERQHEALDVLRARVGELEDELAHAQSSAALFSDHNNQLRIENQELASQVRASLPRPSRPKRYAVPVFQGDMFGGVQMRRELRTEQECKPWQWNLGMLPMLQHLAQTVAQRIGEIRTEAQRAITDKFTPEEMPVGREAFEEAVRRIVSEYEHVPKRADEETN